MPAATASSHTNGNGATNGFYRPERAFNNGVYTPLITAMTDDEQVNLEAVKKQVVRLADSGMGIVLLGTNGEGQCRPRSGRGIIVVASRFPCNRVAAKISDQQDDNTFQIASS